MSSATVNNYNLSATMAATGAVAGGIAAGGLLCDRNMSWLVRTDTAKGIAVIASAAALAGIGLALGNAIEGGHPGAPMYAIAGGAFGAGVGALAVAHHLPGLTGNAAHVRTGAGAAPMLAGAWVVGGAWMLLGSLIDQAPRNR